VPAPGDNILMFTEERVKSKDGQNGISASPFLLIKILNNNQVKSLNKIFSIL
jgi:hypothetical protein